MVCGRAMRTIGTPAELERRRRLAVRRVKDGYSPAEIADVLGVDCRSVRRWVAAARLGGAKALKASDGAGRPAKLDHTQVKVVHRWLSRCPTECGFDTELWTAGRLAAMIRQAWDVSFNRRYLCDWLRANGYTPQKPERVPRERDQRAIAAWREEAWPRIQKKMRDERRRLLFLDESGLLMAPLVRRTWARRGRRPALLQRARHRDKISLAAGLWMSPDGEVERVSYRLLAGKHFNNVAVAAFLDELLAKTPGPVGVIWDGGNMHKGDPIRELLSRVGSRLHLERLPPYAPMLNPVEQLWCWLKYSRLCNYAPKDLAELESRARLELQGIQRSRNRLRSFWAACELSERGH